MNRKGMRHDHRRPTSANITPITTVGYTTSNAGEDLIGDHYAETVDMTWDQLGDHVQQDLYDVRTDHMLPNIAEFQVTPDTGSTIPVLRITITGLIGTTNAPPRTDLGRDVRGVRLSTITTASTSTTRNGPRFVQHVAVQRPDGTTAIALVGMMHDAVHLRTDGATRRGRLTPWRPGRAGTPEASRQTCPGASAPGHVCVTTTRPSTRRRSPRRRHAPPIAAPTCGHHGERTTSLTDRCDRSRYLSPSQHAIR
jgi:hypothetical protein